MTARTNTAGLEKARELYGNIMERNVRVALSQIAAESKVPSFYSVAERAQVARSTLYRKPELRKLVIDARAEATCSSSPVPSLLDALRSENARLENEVRLLRRQLDSLAESAVRTSKSMRTPSYEYAVVKLPYAA